ncbi:hypothetical protein M407DRAFT_28908 [Tulasnella calospora MUT 4182]|uniref:Uncharacterized protein n=1 Tax=Tulasnella calospora MUT 4182 TaxID=1051891 RepID=A0A0C3Q9W4_9AGAM|nr:hypothetical protein M407DRAFT_28908 [Tulasnella calospora MUT 4182]
MIWGQEEHYQGTTLGRWRSPTKLPTIAIISIMVSFSSLLLICTATAAILAAPIQDNERHQLVARQAITTSETSTANPTTTTTFTSSGAPVLPMRWTRLEYTDLLSARLLLQIQ